MSGELWLVVSIVRLTVYLLRCQVADCQVKWTVLRPDPAVLIVIFLILKVGVDGQSNGLILLLCGEWKMIAD
jgi:hypothetical protein